MDERYDLLAQRIAQLASVPLAQVHEQVEAKRLKLSGLVSKEGAAQIIAAELGVTLDGQRLPIAELTEGMKRARVVGKVTKVFPVRSFAKNGREGKVGSFLLGDASSNIRTVLWDANHIGLLERGDVREGTVLEVGNGSIRNGELHLSAFSDLKVSAESLEDVRAARVFPVGSLLGVNPGTGLKTRAVIVNAFPPKFFGEGEGRRALLNVILDDGTESIRAVVGSELFSLLGLEISSASTPEELAGVRERLVGFEFFFSGLVRMNSYFNQPELAVEAIEPATLDILLGELEAQV